MSYLLTLLCQSLSSTIHAPRVLSERMNPSLCGQNCVDRPPVVSNNEDLGEIPVGSLQTGAPNSRRLRTFAIFHQQLAISWKRFKIVTYSYYGTLIGSQVRSIKSYNFQ